MSSFTGRESRFCTRCLLIRSISSTPTQGRSRFPRPNWRQNRYWCGRRVILWWCVSILDGPVGRNTRVCALQNRSKMRSTPGCGSPTADSWRWRTMGRRTRTSHNSLSRSVCFPLHSSFSGWCETDERGSCVTVRSGG